MNINHAAETGSAQQPGHGESTMLKAGQFRLERILVPTDFSESSKKALLYALTFARQFGAEITLVHVVESPYVAGDFGVVDQDDLRAEILARGQTMMTSFVNELSLDSTVGRRLIRQGTAYHEVTELAKEMNIDLIIMATHGHAGLARVLLGNTTERVTRHAPCPVLVVRQREHDFIKELIPERVSAGLNAPLQTHPA
jgi:nucleotide-binding universal stress UspA family protein